MEEMERNEELEREEQTAGGSSITAETVEETQAETTEATEAAENTEAASGAQKQNSKKRGIMIGAAAVVVAAAAAVLLIPKKDPKTAVIDAFKSIASSEEVSPMEDIFGWEDMYKKMRTSPYQADMELQVDSISEEDLAMLASGKFFVNSKSVPENRKSSAVMGIGYGGMDIASIQAYLDESNLVVSIPELSGKAFTLNYKDDLQGQLDRSPYVGPMLKDSGIDAQGFSEYMQYIQDASYSETAPFDLAGLWQRYKDSSQAVKDLKASMTAEKIESRKQIIDGKEVSVKGYRAAVTKDALTEFLGGTKEFLLADEAFKKDFMEYIDQVSNIYSMGGVEFDGQAFPGGEELWAMLTDETDEGLEQFYEYLGDIDAAVYVRKDGKMAAWEAKMPLSLPDEDGGSDTLDVTVSCTYHGGYSLKANTSTVVKLEGDGETAVLSLDRSSAYDKTSYNDCYVFRLEGNDGDIELQFDGSYTLADGAYTMSGYVKDDGQELGALEIQGAVSNLVKGESFDIAMDTMELTASAGEEQFSLGMSGKYAIVPLTDELDIPEGETMDVLAATEDDWNGVAMEMFFGAMGLMSQFQ